MTTSPAIHAHTLLLPLQAEHREAMLLSYSYSVPPITTGYHTCPDGLLPTQRFPRLTMRLQMVSEMSNSAPNWLVSLLKRKQKTSPPQSHVAQETKHEKGNWGQVVWRTAFETYVPHNRMLLPDRLKSGLTHCRLVWKKSAYYYYTVWNCIFFQLHHMPFF